MRILLRFGLCRKSSPTHCCQGAPRAAIPLIKQGQPRTVSDAPTGRVIRVGPEFTAEALGILREAAAWTISRGVDVWTDAELREQDFLTAAGLGELAMGFSGDSRS